MPKNLKNLKSENNAINSHSINVFKFVLVFSSYYIFGHLGLKLDAENDYATLIWAPSGIALAALYLWGFQYWPAIFISAILVNLKQQSPIIASVIIAVGDIIEVGMGVLLLNWYRQFDSSLSKVRDVIVLILVAATTSIPNATIGTFASWIENMTALGGIASTWKAWWLGDTMGIIIITPLLLILTHFSKPKLNSLKIIEVIFLTVAIISINLFAFTNFSYGYELSLFAQPYILFPCVIWTAFRFGQAGTVSAIFIISCFAMTGTAMNIGTFAHETVRGNLFLLDGFIMIIAVTGLTLAAAVTERKKATADLMIIEGQLKEAIRHRDDFLSIASHELKTPITSLSLQLQLTERSIDINKSTLPSPQKLASVLDMSIKQVNRLSNLIEDLFDVSRFHTGKLNFVFEVMNLSQLVRDMSDRSSEHFKKIRSPVEIKIQENVYINGDYARLEQVMDNLISNAIKYAPGSTIKISLSANSEKAAIIIEDSGIGIAKEKQIKIFDRYERGTESRDISGLGLGLFIVSEIVKAHSGTIVLDSDLDKGSIFRIELPISLEREDNFV